LYLSLSSTFLLHSWSLLITIADAGMGNFNSIANMLDFLEIDSVIRKKPMDVASITHLILPGVGSFDSGMELLDSSGWKEAISSLSPETKILGICLGMHLLTQGSEEGISPGLGMVEGICRKFDPSLGPVPHMGWNEVEITRENPILPDNGGVRRFYFSHSYFVELQNTEIAFAKTHYTKNFVSAFSVGNIFGFQFHPEKSHHYGMQALESFASL
jgi:glutamine amidotransferase